MRNFKLLFALLLITTQLSAIDINRKFGKVSKEELLMEYYDKDSSAEAVILFDIGNTHFEYNARNGFEMVYERIVRIKILNKNGFDYADFSISLYHENENEEDLSNLQAITYNLENNKITKTKLNKSDIYNIKDNPNSTVNFSLPAVREGSVIEVKYKISSNLFYNLQEWLFQHSIPCMWSEYTVEIPEYFRYNKIAKGYLNFDINESKTSNDFFMFTERVNKDDLYFGKTEIKQREIEFEKKVIHLAVKDAPAMKSEAHMLAMDNYRSKIEFELAFVQFPGDQAVNYSENWESITKNLMEHSDFGAHLKNSNYLSTIVENIKEKTDNPKKQVLLLQRFVVNNYKWDGKNTKFASKYPRTTFIQKIGNSADLNFLMLLFLREAGFNADPVILSTRNYGLLNPIHPSMSQMNYVVTLLRLEGEEILIDATDPYCLPGMLPPKCINDKGRIINEQKSEWINIEPSANNTLSVSGDFIITEQSVNGTLLNTREGFASYNFRQKYKSFNNEQDYIAEIESENPGIKINEYKFENIDSIGKPIIEEYTNLTIGSIENLGEIIYFNPIVIDRIDENPFKLEKRNFPIDFNYLYNHKYVFNYTIPEGYIVEEMPKSEQITLPEKSAEFNYLISNEGNNIQVTIQFEINKRQFLPEEYEFMKDFYNKIIAKESEQIIIKKS